jgi:hypothetical protein
LGSEDLSAIFGLAMAQGVDAPNVLVTDVAAPLPNPPAKRARKKKPVKKTAKSLGSAAKRKRRNNASPTSGK